MQRLRRKDVRFKEKTRCHYYCSGKVRPIGLVKRELEKTSARLEATLLMGDVLSLPLLIIWGSGRGVWALDTNGQTWCLAILPLLRWLKRSGGAICSRGCWKNASGGCLGLEFGGRGQTGTGDDAGLVGCKETW
jgi:hypothetical protein